MQPGVGVIFNGTVEPFLEAHPDAVDYVCVIPERFWVDHGRSAMPRFTPLPDELAILERLAQRYRLIAHGVGLSIASAGPLDDEHVAELRRWKERYGFKWISEHLSAVRVSTEVSIDHH